MMVARRSFPFWNGRFLGGTLPSQSLTWNLKMAAWNRSFLLWFHHFFWFHVKLGECTLPETNMAPTGKPFQTENHLPIPNFQVGTVSCREGNFRERGGGGYEKNMGVSKNRGKNPKMDIVENPIKIDDLGGKHSIFGSTPTCLLGCPSSISSRSKVGSVVGMVDCWPAQQPRSWSFVDFCWSVMATRSTRFD